MPGLGRGPPGRGPAAPVPPGRGAPTPARDCGRGMPWLGANGLLPGRGAPPAASPRPSRGSRPSRPPRPMPWLGANGLLPGRGALAGRGPGRGPEPPPSVGASCRAAGAWGAAGAAGACGDGAAGAAGAGAAGAGACAAGASGAGACRAGTGAAGDVGAGAATCGAGAAGAGDGATGAADVDGADGAGAGAGAAGAAGAGAEGVAAPGPAGLAAPLRSSCGKVSDALRTTGASMVELAVLTYSPMVLRWAIRVLLSVPSSLASALTRTLATFLLLRSVQPSKQEARTASTGGSSLLSSHRVLIACNPLSVPMDGRSLQLAGAGQVFLHRSEVGRDAETKRTPEGPATDGLAQALPCRVQPCATSRQSVPWIWDDASGGSPTARAVRLRDHSQQCRPAIRSTAPHTRPGWFPFGGAGVRRPESSPVGPHHCTA